MANRNFMADRGSGVWLVLFMLLAAVVVPTACVLWFMNAAVRNERLAVRQKLQDAYLPLLEAAAGEAESYWSDKAAALANVGQRASAGEVFAELVTAGVCDGAVIYGPSASAVDSDRAAALEKRLRIVIEDRLRRLSVEFDEMAIAVSPDLSNAQCRFSGLRERKGIGGENVWTDIDGSLRVNYTGQGIWSVWGLGDLGHVELNISTSYPTVLRALAGQARKEVETGRLEYELSDPGSAAAAYAEIARQAADVNLAARALQAQARCLVRAGKREAAIEMLAVALADPQYNGAADAHGRLIAPNARLLALELMREPAHPHHDETLQLLVQRLNDYGDPVLPSSQRRFLMRRLQELVPDCPPFATLAAEDLTAEYLAAGPGLPQPSQLLPSALHGVWHMASPNGTVVALFRQKSLVAELQSLVDAEVSLSGVTLKLAPAGSEQLGAEPFLTAPAGEYLPEWQLALYLEGPDPFAAAADRQIAAYLWTGLLVIAVTAAIALAAGRYLLRQMKMTRLKNDFIATVSHELKTPLASMRVLVDTLLERTYHDHQQAGEYLRLISKENERLSHLIDNFLTFSRMERNKGAFEFQEVGPGEIAMAAAELVRGKFESHGCRFDVDIADGLPALIGDRDALITVLLNLLDNAFKYSENDWRIVLRAYLDGGSICFEVRDNGVGMSRRAVRKIFDRFYQVDRSLSRSAGGCGLGLSIVKFIVDAHGGSIDVKSQPGKGSTFTVKLPASGAGAVADS